MKRNHILLFSLSALVIFSSCQKELDDTSVPVFCGLSSITIKDGSGDVLALYQYTYDSALGRPVVLHVEDFDNGSSNTVYPTYKQDTIFFGSNGYLTLDASKRIKTLTELQGGQGIIDGDYYFSYNTNGQLSDRLIDDNVNDAIRTDFTYTNGNLSTVEDDLPGYPRSVSTTVTYGSSPEIKGYSQYQLLEFFPELLLYMPAVQLGKTSSAPIASVNTKVSLPGQPAITFTTTYSKYSLTPEGWLSSFETSTTFPGAPAIVTTYQFQYRCFN